MTNKRATAEYIAAHLNELRVMAATSGLTALEYLIGLAAMEAEEQKALAKSGSERGR